MLTAVGVFDMRKNRGDGAVVLACDTKERSGERSETGSLILPSRAVNWRDERVPQTNTLVEAILAPIVPAHLFTIPNLILRNSGRKWLR